MASYMSRGINYILETINEILNQLNVQSNIIIFFLHTLEKNWSWITKFTLPVKGLLDVDTTADRQRVRPLSAWLLVTSTSTEQKHSALIKRELTKLEVIAAFRASKNNKFNLTDY